MKPLPLVLLNVVVAAAAILIYDQVRAPEPKPAGASLTSGLDPSVEARLAALERGRPALLKTDGIDPRVAKRLDALEQQMRERPAAAPSPVAATDDEAEQPDPLARPKLAPGDKASPEDIERFRKLQKAARAAEKAQRMRKRVDLALAKLDLDLTEQQRSKLAATFAGFQSRRDEIWREVKTSAATQGGDVDWRTIIADTNATLRSELSDRVDDFLPRADAERVSGALLGSGK